MYQPRYGFKIPYRAAVFREYITRTALVSGTKITRFWFSRKKLPETGAFCTENDGAIKREIALNLSPSNGYLKSGVVFGEIFQIHKKENSVAASPNNELTIFP